MKIGDKRRDMGLGGVPVVELAQAREKARAARALVDQGVDPIVQRKQAKSALAAQQAAQKTFKRCALEYIDSKSAEWSNAKHASQWTNTLETYAFPRSGRCFGRMWTHSAESTDWLPALAPPQREQPIATHG